MRLTSLRENEELISTSKHIRPSDGLENINLPDIVINKVVECSCPKVSKVDPLEELREIEEKVENIRSTYYVDAIRPEFRYGGFRIGEHQINY